MNSVNTPTTPTAPTPRQQRRTVQFAEWVLPIGHAVPATALETALDQATKDPARGDQPIWYRLDHTPTGPVIVVGYNTETTEISEITT